MGQEGFRDRVREGFHHFEKAEEVESLLLGLCVHFYDSALGFGLQN